MSTIRFAALGVLFAGVLLAANPSPVHAATNTNCLVGNYVCSTVSGGERSWSWTLSATSDPVRSPYGSSYGAGGDDVQNFIARFIGFINWTLIPLILALAFLFFIWNIARYFIIGGADEGNRERARQLALYGILAFVIIVSLWGIVNLLVRGLGFDRTQSITPDYMEQEYYY